MDFTSGTLGTLLHATQEAKSSLYPHFAE